MRENLLRARASVNSRFSGPRAVWVKEGVDEELYAGEFSRATLRAALSGRRGWRALG